MFVSKITSKPYFLGNASTQKTEKNDKADVVPTKSNLFTAKNLVIAGAAIAGVVAVTYITKGRKSNAVAATSSPNSNQNTSLVNEIIVVGKDKVKALLRQFKHEDFDASKTFKVNMHIHSKASDGSLAPLEILRQAKECADRLPKGEKFTFSLTDHDTIAGVQEIVREINKNPSEYANVRFIPGIEMSTSYTNPELMTGSVNLDFLIYGFDVNNPKLLQEIARRKQSLDNSTQEFVGAIASRLGKEFLDFNVIKNSSKQLKNVCSNGYVNDLREFVTPLLSMKGVSDKETMSLLEKCFGHAYQPLKANISTVEAGKLASAIDAFSSLAHPGKIHFSHANLHKEGTDVTNTVLRQLYSVGSQGLEGNYMSYKSQDAQNWGKRIYDAFKTQDMHIYLTGGYDTHGSSIMRKSKRM